MTNLSIKNGGLPTIHVTAILISTGQTANVTMQTYSRNEVSYRRADITLPEVIL